MAPPESATVTDLAAARRRKTRGAVADDSSADEETRAGAKKTPAPRRVSNRRFDTEKVERLKLAIEEGRYEIDPESVADRFIEHERNS